MQANEIKHIWCVPDHPTSNGLAKHFVQTLMRAILADHQVVLPEHQLANCLLSYRTTHHAKSRHQVSGSCSGNYELDLTLSSLLVLIRFFSNNLISPITMPSLVNFPSVKQ